MYFSYIGVLSQKKYMGKASIARPNLMKSATLYAQSVLIDSYGPAVQQECLALGAYTPQVGGHDQRGGHYAPQRHLYALLVVA